MYETPFWYEVVDCRLTRYFACIYLLLVSLCEGGCTPRLRHQQPLSLDLHHLLHTAHCLASPYAFIPHFLSGSLTSNSGLEDHDLSARLPQRTISARPRSRRLTPTVETPRPEIVTTLLANDYHLKKGNMAAQDVEGAEKPVREQLKKASIGGLSEEARAAANEVRNAADQSTENEQARIVKGEETPLDTEISNAETGEKNNTEPAIQPVRYHTRKRSRDSTAEDDELNEHKRKISGERSRAQSPAAESAATNGASTLR